VVHDFSILTILIHYALELQEQLLTMLQPVNISLDFSPKKALHVHVNYIPLNQDGISCTSVIDLTAIGTQEEIQ